MAPFAPPAFAAPCAQDAEMTGGGPLAAARERERSRIAAILGAPEAASRMPLAIALATTTALPRGQALALMQRSEAAALPPLQAAPPTPMGRRALARST